MALKDSFHGFEVMNGKQTHKLPTKAKSTNRFTTTVGRAIT
jgi:hypothetical protein